MSKLKTPFYIEEPQLSTIAAQQRPSYLGILPWELSSLRILHRWAASVLRPATTVRCDGLEPRLVRISRRLERGLPVPHPGCTFVGGSSAADVCRSRSVLGPACREHALPFSRGYTGRRRPGPHGDPVRGQDGLSIQGLGPGPMSRVNSHTSITQRT